MVTFDLCHAPLIAKLFNDPAGSVRLEGRVVDCVEVVLLHPPRKWVVPLCCGCGVVALTVGCAVLVAMFVANFH